MIFFWYLFWIAGCNGNDYGIFVDLNDENVGLTIITYILTFFVKYGVCVSRPLIVSEIDLNHMKMSTECYSE